MDSSGSSKLDDSAAVELTGKIMVAAIIILFLVVVFVLFLHLYAKWFWRRLEDESQTHPSRRGRRRGFVFAPGQDPPSTAALRRGLDPSVLRSLPVLVFRPEEFKDGMECAVCLSELVEGEKARLLPKCNHGFHLDCIDMWFQSHSTCPLCRNAVASDSISSSTNLEFSETSVQSSSENSPLSAYTSEPPNFPTNILFWGDQKQVKSGALFSDEGPSSENPCVSSSSSSSSSVAATRSDGMLVIDIPRPMLDNFPSCSPSSGSRYNGDEEAKSPLPTRMRSLKRLLSREKRVVVVPCSPHSVDVEQGERRGLA